MSYPRVVRIAKTPVHITLFGAEINEFSEHEPVADGDFLCNMQAGGSIEYGEQKQRVQLTGTLLIDGDICPECGAPVNGKAVISETEYKVIRAQKWRNPDGTVNYTQLEIV